MVLGVQCSTGSIVVPYLDGFLSYQSSGTEMRTLNVIGKGIFDVFIRRLTTVMHLETSSNHGNLLVWQAVT